MNRKSFLAAAAATLALTLGLGAAPLASAAQPTPANNIVDVAVAVDDRVGQAGPDRRGGLGPLGSGHRGLMEPP